MVDAWRRSVQGETRNVTTWGMVVMRTPRIVVGVVVAAVVGVPVAWAPPAGAAPGDLDPTFGTGGRVTTDVAGGSDVALAVVIQPDGRIVVAGISVGASTREDIVLARYSTDGTLDASFGVGGLVVTDVAGSEDDGFALVQQRDGKLVVAGTTFDQPGTRSSTSPWRAMTPTAPSIRRSGRAGW